MNQERPEETGPESLIQAWLKTTLDFWDQAAKGWLASDGEEETPGKGFLGRTQDHWQAAARTYLALVRNFGEPETMKSVFDGVSLSPEIATKMAHSWWEGYFTLQRQWLEKTVGLAAKAEGYGFEGQDQEAFKAWTDLYEQELGKFFNVPQLGLTRFYQERAGRAMDKLNLFQAALSEFLYLLYLPVEKSLRIMQQELQELSEESELSGNFKDYYRKWIKILEGRYMTLLQSPEYIESLSRTLNAFLDFTVARQESLEDVVKTLAVPTQSEMDEMYRELYLLKKEIKEIKKSAKSAETKAQSLI